MFTKDNWKSKNISEFRRASILLGRDIRRHPVKNCVIIGIKVGIAIPIGITVGNIMAKHVIPPVVHAAPVVYSIVTHPSHTPARALEMAGYKEDHSFKTRFVTEDYAAKMQAKYLKDKKELEDAIKNPEAIPPVKDYADMIEKVSQISDRQAQVEAVNALVNINLRYDFDEMKRDVFNFRSLSEALRDGKTICDTNARLKLFALEKLGFDQDDIRWVDQTCYAKNGGESGHAVVLVRIGNKTWIMNSQRGAEVKAAIPPKMVESIIQDASEMETAACEINATGKSMSGDKKVNIPHYAFNSTQAAFYIWPNNYNEGLRYVPVEALVDREERIKLDQETIHKFNLSQVMAPALSRRYQMKWHIKYKGMIDSPSGIQAATINKRNKQSVGAPSFGN